MHESSLYAADRYMWIVNQRAQMTDEKTKKLYSSLMRRRGRHNRIVHSYTE
jgi:hypothetical protein